MDPNLCFTMEGWTRVLEAMRCVEVQLQYAAAEDGYRRMYDALAAGTLCADVEAALSGGGGGSVALGSIGGECLCAFCDSILVFVSVSARRCRVLSWRCAGGL